MHNTVLINFERQVQFNNMYYLFTALQKVQINRAMKSNTVRFVKCTDCVRTSWQRWKLKRARATYAITILHSHFRSFRSMSCRCKRLRSQGCYEPRHEPRGKLTFEV